MFHGNKSYPDTHLNAPIRSLIQEAAITKQVGNCSHFKYKKACSDLDRLKWAATHLGHQIGRLSADPTSGQCMVQDVLRHTQFDLSEEEFAYCDWDGILEQSLGLIQLQLSALPEACRVDLEPSSAIPALLGNTVLSGYIHAQALWEFIIYLSSSSLADVPPDTKSPFWKRTKEIRHDQLMYQVRLDSTHFLILSRFNALLIGPDPSAPGSETVGFFIGRETLLMYANILSERACLYLSAGLAEYYATDNLLNFTEIKEIFAWGDNLLGYIGKEAYKILKSFEPLVLGKLLQSHEEPYCDNTTFLAHTLSELDPLFDQFPMARTLTNNLLDVIGNLNPHKASQAFGLYRCWGHPSIDTEAGIKKVVEVATAPKMMDYELITKIERKFKELLFLSYRRRHKVWPNFTLEPGGDLTYIGAKLQEGHIFNKRNYRYRLQDWDYVTLEKSVEIEDNFNLSTLLSDKAVSPNKSEVIQSILTRKGIPYISRRVIMAWLKSNYTTAKLFLQQLQEEGFSSEDLIIGVCPKEREMKLQPRLFAVMTMKVRLYFVLTEALLAEHLLPLFPQVTMIDDAIKLTKKIFHATKSMGNKSLAEILIPIITNIDFEKWNLNMRAELVNPIFRIMDQFFGFHNIFEATHAVFSQSTIYLTDNTLELKLSGDCCDLADGPGVWHNHKGGFEGLRQKGWTIVTIIILELISDAYPLKHTIMGQGDNQVIVSRLTSHHREAGKLHKVRGPKEIQMIHQSFLRTLEDTLARIGLPLKASETWSSCRLFMYGKEMYWDSMPLAMSQKRIARMFPLANEMYPSLENALSTIYCNGNSAALADISALHAFIVGTIQAMRCVRSHFKYSPLLGKGLVDCCIDDGAHWSVQLVTTSVTRQLPVTVVEQELRNKVKQLSTWILLFPKVLGGYPVQNILDFLTRGFPDPVTQWLSLLLKVSKSDLCPSATKDVIRKFLLPEFSPEVNASMLLEDPVAVNVLMPTNGAGVIRKQVEDWMKSTDFIRNQSFRDMMVYAFVSQRDIDILLSKGDVYWPRLMHDIHDATVGGYAKSFIDKIAKTSTSMEVARSSSTTALVPKLRHAERRYFNSVIYKIISRGPPGTALPQCSARHADWLRCTGWRKTKMAGVTTPHPLEMFDVTLRTELGCPACSSDQSARKNYIAAKIADELRQHPQLYLSQIGDSIPYLGSATTEKVKPPAGIKLINTTPLLKRALNLLRANNWFVSTSDPLGRLLRRLVNSMTDLDPTLFETPAVSKTGSADHRYHDSALKHGGYNMVKYNSGTFLHLITTTLSKYAKGSENVTLHYQATLCYLQGLFSLMLNYHLVEPHHCALHAHLGCPCCIVPVHDDVVQGDPLLDRVVFPDLSQNSLLWVPKEQIPVLTVGYKFSSLDQYDSRHHHFGVAAELTHRCLQAKEDLLHEGSEISPPTAPIVWGMTMNSVWILEASVCILFLMFLSLQPAKALGEINDELLASFFDWLAATQLTYLMPLGILFYDTYSRINLASSQYGIRSPSAAPPTNRAVCKAVLAAVQAVALSGLDRLLQDWSQCFQTIWGAILSPFDSLILTVVHAQICKSSSKLVPSETKTLINYIRIAKAADIEAPTDVIAAVTAALTIGPRSQRTSLVPPSSHRVVLDWLHTLRLTYSGASADYLQKTYTGPTNMQLCVEVPVTTLPRDQLLALPTAAFKVYELDRMRDIEDYTAWVIPEEQVPPAQVEYYSHFYRPDPLDSTAHYKLLSILHGTGLLYKPVLYALSGGDGTGGNTLTILRVYPDSKVYYNTLLSFTDIVPQILGEFSPASFDGYSGWEARLIGFVDSVEGVTDFTDPLFVDQVSHLITPQRFDLVVSDMEGGGWDSPFIGCKLINNVCRMAQVLQPTGVACVKFYASNHYLLAVAVGTLGAYFAQVEVWRSQFTSSKSTECYLIAKSPIQPPSDTMLIDPEYTLSAFSPSATLLHLCQDLKHQMEADHLKRATWTLSVSYSELLKVTIHTQALERDLVVLLRRSSLLTKGNRINLHSVFERLFRFSGSLLNPKAIVDHKLVSAKISDHVETDKAWTVVAIWCLAIVLMLDNVELVEESLKCTLQGWLVGFQGKNHRWGFILSTAPCVPDKEGYCARFTFFQRYIPSFQAYGKWCKRIMKLASLLARKVSLDGPMSHPIRVLRSTWGPAIQRTEKERSLKVSKQSDGHLLLLFSPPLAPLHPFDEVKSARHHEWMLGARFVKL